MNLLLQEAVKRAGGDELGFFNACYFWRFQKQVDTSGDVLAYRVQGTIPSYVVEFLKFHYEI